MILKNIELKKFKLYETFTMDDNFNCGLNVITGKNNKGKSTIINALNIVLNNSNKLEFNDINSGYIHKKYKSLIEDVNEEIDNFQISIKLTFEFFEDSELFKLMPFMDKIDVNGEFTYEKKWTIDKNKWSEFISKIEKKESYKKEYFEEHFCTNLKSYILVNNKTVDKSNIQGIWTLLHIPALRIKENEEVIYEKYFKQYNFEIKYNFFDDITKIDQMLNEKLEKEESVKKIISEFEEITNSEETYVLESNNYSNFDISKMKIISYLKENNFGISQKSNGTGIINILYIVSTITETLKSLKNNNQKYATIIIEEPEAFTHSELETNFLKYIKKINNKFNSKLQIIIVTHSPSLVSKIHQNYIYHLNENKLKNLKKLSENKFFKNFIDSNRSKLLFATKVIFVEGPTEEILIKWIISNHATYSESYEPYEIFVLNSKYYKDSWINILKFFEYRKVVVITDNDYNYSNRTKYENICEKIKNGTISYSDVKNNTTNSILNGKLNSKENIWKSDDFVVFTQEKISNVFNFDLFIPRSLEDSILANNEWLYSNECNFAKMVLNKNFNQNINTLDFNEKIEYLFDSKKMLMSNKTKYDFVNEIIEVTDNVVLDASEKIENKNNFVVPKYIVSALNYIFYDEEEKNNE